MAGTVETCNVIGLELVTFWGGSDANGPRSPVKKTMLGRIASKTRRLDTTTRMKLDADVSHHGQRKVGCAAV